MIKIGAYIWRQGIKPPCDSCGERFAVYKIYAEKDGDYIVGIRVCQVCLDEFKEDLK